MGFESDKLVYDYLSRVGDLAQTTALTAAERARLVTTLRQDIDTRRATSGPKGDGEREVRKLLSRIGTPDDVVQRALRAGASAPSSAPSVPAPSVPAPSVPVPSAPVRGPVEGDDDEGGVGEWWRQPSRPAVPAPRAGRGARRGFDGWDTELDFGEDEDESEGAPASEPDPAPVEAPARRPLFRRPAAAAPAPVVVEPQPVAPLPRAPLFRRRQRTVRGVSGPLLFVEALAALLLGAGAVLGLWYLALVGWVAAYFSARLSDAARKFAAIGIPVLTVVGGFVWLWARATGRWGGPALTGSAYHHALLGLGPVLLRTASALSSAFLAWLVYRQRTS